jgi:hypothetical protein
MYTKLSKHVNNSDTIYCLLIRMGSEVIIQQKKQLKVGCLHPVACTRSGSGFSSNATLF